MSLKRTSVTFLIKYALLLLSVLVFHTSGLAAGPRSELRLQVGTRDIVSPCHGIPLAFELVRGPDDSVLLAWVESNREGLQSLRIALYSAARSKWDLTKTIVSTASLLHPSHNSELSLTYDESGRMGLAWTGPSSGGGGFSQVFASFSEDGGATWKSPFPLSVPEQSSSQPSLAWRQGAGWIASWLESTADGGTRVCVREAGQAEPTRFEGAVAMPSATTAIVSFPDGTDLIAFRALLPKEGCDPWTIRRYENIWEAPSPIGHEGWKGVAKVRDSIRLSVLAPRVAAAWFTSAGDEPRILVAFSPDAGARWTNASRADLGNPVGRPDVALLHDGSQLVTWVEDKGSDTSLSSGIFLRRYAPSGGTVIPSYVIRDEARNFLAGPRLAVLRDQPGSPVELLMAFEQTSDSAVFRIVRVHLPSPSALEELDSSCNCGSTATPGFPIRGRILAIDADRSTLKISHEPVPGMLRSGEMEVQVSSAVTAAVREGRGVLGRIERRNGKWIMSDVRTFAVP